MDTGTSQKYDLNKLLGYVEPKTFRKFENGRMVSYCFSIKRDRNGVELSRTEPVAIGSIGYDDGTPFTEEDYDRWKGGKHSGVSIFCRKISRLLGFITGV